MKKRNECPLDDFKVAKDGGSAKRGVVPTVWQGAIHPRVPQQKFFHSGVASPTNQRKGGVVVHVSWVNVDVWVGQE